jgi:hypothetical protein
MRQIKGFSSTAFTTQSIDCLRQPREGEGQRNLATSAI